MKLGIDTVAWVTQAFRPVYRRCNRRLGRQGTIFLSGCVRTQATCTSTQSPHTQHFPLKPECHRCLKIECICTLKLLAWGDLTNIYLLLSAPLYSSAWFDQNCHLVHSPSWVALCACCTIGNMCSVLSASFMYRPLPWQLRTSCRQCGPDYTFLRHSR